MNTLSNRLYAISLTAALLAVVGFCSTRDARSAPAVTAADSAPGLTVTFASKDGKSDTRLARIATLFVPAQTPPTSFLQPGPFKATFEGFIEQKLRGDFKFSATGKGKVKISVADKPVFEANGDLGAAEEKPATLKKGKNKFVVEYESPDEGDALLRVAWSSEDFPPEPIDPKLFSHELSNKAVAAGMQMREGRALFADLHCARCHDASLTDAAKNGGMAELAKDAPNLEEVGGRLNQKWMTRWISDPKSLRPDTSMPNVFHGKAGATVQAAADVAAYLTTLGQGNEAPVNGDATAGGKLVARLGCIGCHTLPDKDVGSPDAKGRVSWHYVKAKFKPTALVEFIEQPEKHYAWIRMPNFRFTDEEAKQVAAYLLTNSVDLPGDAPKGDAANGQKLVQSAGCISCHTIKGENQAKSIALAEITKDAWAKGCMAADEAGRGKAPDFGLTGGQRDALQAFASTDRSSLKRDVPAEFAERQIVELNCLACHTRDALPDAWDESMKELEGLVKGDTLDPESGGVAPNAANAKGPLAGEAQPGTGDQSRPPLTWVGEKLKPEWMATFIGGKLDYKPRVWMLGRMPGFPARAEGLAIGLAMEHGCPSKSPEDKAPDEELAKTGKQLVSRNGGFSCVQCHGIGAIAPISPFEAPSINFKYTKERIRREYYDRWMRDPTRVVANTKMPKFQNDGKTALNEILDGDADKQFDAIWSYLQAGRNIEHPEAEQK